MAWFERWTLLFTLLAPRLLLGIVLFNVAEEIGWMGFLQHRWQERYGPLKASLLVTVPFALYHLPSLFVENGLALALVVLPVVAVVHLAARVMLAWLYNSTGRSVLLVGLFHSTVDAAVLYGSRIIPGPGGTATYLSFAIVLAAAVVIVVVTRGRLSYRPTTVERPASRARPWPCRSAWRAGTA